MPERERERERERNKKRGNTEVFSVHVRNFHAYVRERESGESDELNGDREKEA